MDLLFRCLSRLIFYNLAVIFNVSWEKVSAVSTYSMVLTGTQNLLLFHCIEDVLLAGGRRGGGGTLLRQRNFSLQKKEIIQLVKNNNKNPEFKKSLDSGPTALLQEFKQK